MKTRKQTLHLRLHGRVQGVWFRDGMCREAERRGVTGWVRNRSDGSLEAMLQGEEKAVQALLAWAKVGPPGARVDRCEVSEGDGEYDRFTRLPTL